jgi:hypothetical protein
MACFPVALLLAAACASTDNNKPMGTGGAGGGAGCTHFDYSKWSASPTPLTLTADIMPIFTASCALGIPCHGVGSGKPPTLGGTGVMPADVYMAIVDVNSTEVATMKYVAKSDPANSYMMRKLEQDNPGCELACVNPAIAPMGCQSRMPSGGPPWLDDPSIDKIRSWIKQGANM